MQDPKPKQEPSMLLPKEEVAHVKCFICRPQMAFCSYCALFTKRPFVASIGWGVSYFLPLSPQYSNLVQTY